MGSAGLLGLAVPEEYGGGAGDSLAIVVLSEELARASGGIAVTALVTGYMSTPHIAKFGTEAQCAQYLPSLVAGEKIASIAVTEPGTGSNVGGITTRATPADGGYRLDGTKMFITNAGIADVVIVAARTSPDGHRGVTTFIVEADNPGLSVGQPLRKMGWHGSDTREVVLSDCFVPADAVLGEGGRGFHQIMSAFQLERLTLAGMGIGHAAECLAAATAYARDRDVFGVPLISKQAIRHRLAALSIELGGGPAADLPGGGPAGRGASGGRGLGGWPRPSIRRPSRPATSSMSACSCSAAAASWRRRRWPGTTGTSGVLRIGGGTDEIQLEILAKDLPA